MLFGATGTEVNCNDWAGPWILGNVDGGFPFFAEVAAHWFSLCAAFNLNFCATRFWVVGVGRDYTGYIVPINPGLFCGMPLAFKSGKRVE